VRYFPHWPPDAAHTRCNTLIASYEYFVARCFRTRFATVRPGPGGRAAATRRRRALSRDHPVTDTTSSRTLPFSALPAFRYAFAYLLVISTLDAIVNSLLMAQQRHRYAGIPI